MSEKTQGNIGLLDKEETRKAPPPKLYNVVLINDDFTTVDFVTNLLTDIFKKNREQAFVIALDVHKKGKGIGGTYTRDVAETKIQNAVERARRQEHPLLLTLEPK